MTVNIGNVDRIARAIVGVVLMYVAFISGAVDGSALKWVAAVGGLIMLGTSAVKFCPLYRLVGLRTCKV